MKTDDENNELNNEIIPNDFNDEFSNQGIVSNLDDDIYNFFKPIYKNKDKRNNDVYDQTHNTSKKLDIIMEGKKENNSLKNIESKNKKSITFITHKTRRTKNPDKIISYNI